MIEEYEVGKEGCFHDQVLFQMQYTSLKEHMF